MATFEKTEVVSHDLKLYFTSQLYRKVEMMQNNTFTAKNGIKIKCHQRYNNTYNGKAVKLDENACDSILTMKAVVEIKELEAALTELGSMPLFDSSWTTFGQNAGVHLAFKKEEVVTPGTSSSSRRRCTTGSTRRSSRPPMGSRSRVTTSLSLDSSTGSLD